MRTGELLTLSPPRLPGYSSGSFPSGAAGDLAYNLTTGAPEFHNGSVWGPIGGGIASYAFASRPSASSVAAGTLIFINDVGQRGCYLKSDGTDWASAFRQTLHVTTVPVDFTGSLASQILTSFLVPGGFVHPNGVFILTAVGGRSAGTANNVSPQMRVGANTTGGSTLIYSNGSSVMQVFKRFVIFQNSRSVQVAPSGGNTSYGVTGTLPSNLGYDFNNDQYFSAGGSLSNAADTIRIQFFAVEYM